MESAGCGKTKPFVHLSGPGFPRKAFPNRIVSAEAVVVLTMVRTDLVKIRAQGQSTRREQRSFDS
jgi:hypothetical protein